MPNVDLKSYKPSTIEDSNIFDQVYAAQSSEINKINTSIADIKNQLSVNTATWGLAPFYEKPLGIVTDLSKSYDYRRSVIKAKMRGSGKFNNALVKAVCDSFTNGDVDVKFDGTIHVTFINIYGIPPNMDDLKAAINDIKPAYLLLDYIFRYLIWDEFDNYNKTFDQWDGLNLTWDEFESYKG